MRKRSRHTEGTSSSKSHFHTTARSWLEKAMNGVERLGLPWVSLMAFQRITTHPRVTGNPLTSAEAWSDITDWLDADQAWTPTPETVTAMSSISSSSTAIYAVTSSQTPTWPSSPSSTAVAYAPSTATSPVSTACAGSTPTTDSATTVRRCHNRGHFPRQRLRTDRTPIRHPKNETH